MQLIFALTQFAALTCAAPFSPSLIPRAHVCDNAPSTTAGTTLPARSNPNLVFWCDVTTQAYITFTPLSSVSGPALHDMISEAYSYIVGHLALEGDGLVPQGAFLWRNYGFSLRTWNANNHQTTWKVLGAAAFALMDYMGRSGYATARFDIYDGAHQVGSGVLE